MADSRLSLPDFILFLSYIKKFLRKSVKNESMYVFEFLREELSAVLATVVEKAPEKLPLCSS